MSHISAFEVKLKELFVAYHLNYSHAGTTFDAWLMSIEIEARCRLLRILSSAYSKDSDDAFTQAQVDNLVKERKA